MQQETDILSAPLPLTKVAKKGFWPGVFKQFKKNKLAVFSLWLILLLASIAALADFIANEKPLIAKYNGQVYFPVFKSYVVESGFANWPVEMQNIEWNSLQYDWVVFPPIPYLPKNIDFANAQSIGPFDDQRVKSIHWRHWLGTDELGRDVMAGMIHGTRIALLVGLISMSIASIIGILLGSLAGYFGDDKLKISRARIVLNPLFFLVAIFYAFGSRSYILADAINNSFANFLFEFGISLIILIAFMGVANILSHFLKAIPFFAVKINVAVDIIISRLIEVMVSIPTLFLIISIIAIAKPSIFIVMAIIGFTSWTGIARFIRAELLRVRRLEYIEAAQALGFGEMRTIFKHAIPNALSPVLIAIAFGIATAILIESTLSFLGIGLPAETMTWGSLLSSARQSTSAWWLAIFPGLAIFITVTIYNLVGEGLTDALDPRQKR
ncbi:MAG: ABC transporter permease [Bacteroidetes bacterium]|nr:ABC transporter permease [Bacteroidota bacterium]HET6245136.1 ABC transporter permease [Bacteroidia bacterium]